MQGPPDSCNDKCRHKGHNNTDLLVEQEQSNYHLERKAPELVKTLTKVNNTVGVGAHKVNHL